MKFTTFSYLLLGLAAGRRSLAGPVEVPSIRSRDTKALAPRFSSIDIYNWDLAKSWENGHVFKA